MPCRERRTYILLLKAERHRGFQHLRRRPHFSPSGPSAAMEFGKEAEERVLSALSRSERQQQQQHHSSGSSSSSSRWGEWADWGPCSRSCGEGLQVTQMGLPERKNRKWIIKLFFFFLLLRAYLQKRTRRCPGGTGGGGGRHHCRGHSAERRSCNIFKCKGKRK